MYLITTGVLLAMIIRTEVSMSFAAPDTEMDGLIHVFLTCQAAAG
jgi:hypothetical protein